MIVASFGVHLMLWPLGNRVLELGWPATSPPPVDGLMEVSLLPSDEEADLQKGTLLPGQLVDPDRVFDQRKPEQPTDRISEFDSRVDHETRAPNRRAALEYDPRTLGDEAGKSSSAQQGSTEEVVAQPLPLGRPMEGTADDLGHRVDDPLPEGDEGAAQHDAGPHALRPTVRGSADAIRKTFGGSGSHDALDDVAEGTESILNSERFRFASFFNRLRDQVEQQWDPNGVMRRADADGRTYGSRTRTTILRVKLTPKGAIQKLDIIQDSGVIELDKEAIRALHQAAPFVNPPPEMVDASTGLIEFNCLFTLADGKAVMRHRYLR